MIRLHPIPETSHQCPFCLVLLESRGWHIPGMRNLADLRCSRCAREFFGDLPAGQALYTPMLLEKATGVVHDQYQVDWFAGWLQASYASRIDTPLSFKAIEAGIITREVLLLNCLDTLYGHSLLKLLNLQHYLEGHPEMNVIVLVPSFLEWMVPDGVAQVWVVDLPLSRGSEWNEWLAREIRERLEKLPSVWLSLAFSHPHPNDYRIERFTRVKPFPLGEWQPRLTRPTVTFIWRDDRLWDELASLSSRLKNLQQRAKWSINAGGQRRRVEKLAEALRQQWPALDFAVAGIGEPGGFPDWILDLRKTTLDVATERVWCERYAASHTVIGLHGSNMLLPSAHAGTVVELIAEERWGNFLQDLLFQETDTREMFFRYRVMPQTTTPEDIARLVSLTLSGYPDFLRLMGGEFCRHEKSPDTTRWHQRREISIARERPNSEDSWSS